MVMQTEQSSSHPDSGIYGHMIAAWGNPPAQPPTYECVRVIDMVQQIVVAKGICSGLRGEFRVPLEPGKYIVEAGGRWETAAGAFRYPSLNGGNQSTIRLVEKTASGRLAR